jgi:predicted permease
LTPDDDRVPGGHLVVVLSEAFWRRQYGGNAEIIGKKIVLNGHPFTVAGVAAAPFQGVAYGEPASLWIPMMMVRQFMTRIVDDRLLTMRSAGWLTCYLRLRRGVRIETAQTESNTMAAQLEARYPDSNKGRRFELNENPGMIPSQRNSLRNLLGLLLAAVCLVLLIACGNVATLLLVRAAARGREMAIRLALGANRRALLMQVLAESLLLGLAGAVLGLLLAPWMLSLLARVWQGPELDMVPGGVDLRLLGFTMAIALLSVLLFGMAPAWSAAHTDPGSTLKAASPRATGAGRIERTWVIAQVTISVALVAGGSLMFGSMQRIFAIDPGYRAGQVVMASMDLSILGYSAERGTQYFSDLVSRATSIPGVRAATLAKSTPAVDWCDRVPLMAQGESAPITVETDMNTVSPAYLRTLGIALLAGRDFAASDRSGATPVAIVSKSLANRLWPGQDPLGRYVTIENRTPATPLQIIGVAADLRNRSVLNEASSLLYIPLFQNYDSIARLMLWVDGDPISYKHALLRTLQQANPDLPAGTATTLQEQIEHSVWRQRAAASLLGFFGLLALALASAGIHGVVAYSAAYRTREIGIRMALGADRSRVLGQVVGQGIGLTIAGITMGLPLALWAKPVLNAFLYGSQRFEPMVYLGVPVLFVMVAVAASFLPARRASAIDPAVALREE